MYVCLCVCSLPSLPVQGLNLISSSRYHPQWVKANLLAYSASWSAFPLIAFEFQMKEPLESRSKCLIKMKVETFRSCS